MFSYSEDICLGPFAPKQKIHLKRTDGVVLEGQFCSFNSSKTSITLRQVEVVPPDGRVFDQYRALVRDLSYLQPLERVTYHVKADFDDKFVSTKTKELRRVQDADCRDKYDQGQCSTSDDDGPNHSRASVSDSSEELKNTSPPSVKLLKIVDLLNKSSKSNGSSCKTQNSADLQKQSTNVETVSREEQKLNGIKHKHREDVDRNANKAIEIRHSDLNANNGIPEKKFDRETPPITDAVYEEMKAKVRDHILVNNVGPNLRRAVEDIKDQNILGVGSHGSEQGRRNRLSIISVATQKAVYLFDIQALGKQVFQGCLRDALESDTVEKVVFDCRLFADCLANYHKIKLVNVYDVQAADCVIKRCRLGKFFGRGRSLQELVSQYLNVPSALLATTSNMKTGNSKVWYQRPLPDGFCDYAAWQVVFLPELRDAVEKAFRAPLLHSFQVYLNQFTKLKSSDNVEAQAKGRTLPIEQLDAAFTRDCY